MCSSDELRAIASNVSVSVGCGQRTADLVSCVAERLSDPERVSALMKTAPEDAFALAMRLALGTPTITTSVGFRPVYSRTAPEHSWRAPHLWLAHHGLVIEQEWYTAVMPREVAMVLRGGRPFETVTAVRPPLFCMAVDSSKVDSSAATRAASLVAAVEQVIGRWGSNPVRLLKSAAVGFRDLRNSPRRPTSLPPTHLSWSSWQFARDSSASISRAGRHSRLRHALRGWTSSRRGAGRPWSGPGWQLRPSWAGLVGAGPRAGPTVRRSEDGTLQMCRNYERAASQGSSTPTPERGSTKTRCRLGSNGDAPLLWSEVPVPALTAVGWICRDAELLGILHEGSLSGPGREAARGDMRRAASLLSLEMPPG